MHVVPIFLHLFAPSLSPGPDDTQIKFQDGATPVHFAAAKGHILCLRYLLAEAGATGNEKDDIGASPVHDAAEQGQIGSLKLLAHYGADLAAVDSDELTPRKLAIDRGHHDCGQFLAMALARQSAARSDPHGSGRGDGGESGVPSSAALPGGEGKTGGPAGVPSGNPAHSNGGFGGGGGDLEQLPIETAVGKAAAAGPSSPLDPALSPKEQAKAEKKRLKELKVIERRAKKAASAEAKRLKKKDVKSSKEAGSSGSAAAVGAAVSARAAGSLPEGLGMTGLSSKALSGTHPAHVAVFKSESIRRKELTRPAVDLDLWEKQLQGQAAAP